MIAEGDFTVQMRNLNLPHPKQIAVAVPANLRCGKPEAAAPRGDADWGPAKQTFAGIWEIEPQWLEEHVREVQVLDVREPSEFVGALGHIPSAFNIPLGVLTARMDELSKETPVVAVCRSGARSGQATILLQKAGFTRIANLAGGMMRWHTGRHGVDGGIEIDAGI